MAVFTLYALLKSSYTKTCFHCRVTKIDLKLSLCYLKLYHRALYTLIYPISSSFDMISLYIIFYP